MKKFFMWFANLFKRKPQTFKAIEVNVPIATLSAQHGQYVFDYNRCGVRQEWVKAAKLNANRARANRAIYESIVAKVNPAMPWWVVALIHMMEAGFNLKACLHNGETIIGTGKKTTLVPKGRGPFVTFEEAAIDSLHSERVKNVEKWDLPHILEFLEGYNGWGYRNKGVKSPYLWSGTTIYFKGKYIRDGVYDPEAVSKQLGCVAVMKELGIDS